MSKEINLDGDAAVVGGIHSDSHDTTNNITTHNVTNHSNVNNTVYQAQKTYAELQQNNEEIFLQEVVKRMEDGILDQKELAELNQIRLRLQIPPEKANMIIEEVRKGATLLYSDISNNYLSTQLLSEIYEAIQRNKPEILNRKFNSLEKVAYASQDSNVHHYYHLLLASLYPEKSAVTSISSQSDNYWQLYWSHIAFLKLGNLQNAEMLMPRLEGFGAPKGDVALLLAADAAWDYFNNGKDEYYHSNANNNLTAASELGMTETLHPLWYALNALINENEAEDWCKFYVENTLRGFLPVKKVEIKEKIDMLAPPPMPKFNPQSVNLSQMQGFNPLEAAKKMSLGASGTMPQMSSGFPGTSSFQQFSGNPINNLTSPTPPPMPNVSKPVGVSPVFPKPGATVTLSKSKPLMKDVNTPDPYRDIYGIILTDTDILAKKYGISKEEVIAVFSRFVDTAEEQLMHWAFLDAADHYELLGQHTWQDYNSLVSSFIDQYGIETGPSLHLMIVGGADVIPVPEVNDPYEFGSGSLPTDTCYSFPGTYIPDLAEGGNLIFEPDKARNNVARLPLEDGEISSSIESDLGAYFNLCSLYGGGIPVGNVVMTSNNEWIPASTTMSQHLPLLCDESDRELVHNKMYISPKLLTADEESMAIYTDSLAGTDMLMFNLHGADIPEMPGFYSTDEAFNPSLLHNSNARVFNTVACFGARYTGGYTREQSMVLSALYGGGILVYTGSLIPVPMYSDSKEELREMLLHPGTGSEVFMRLLPLYQLKGMTVGEALLRAKCDYFNMMRHIENDGFSLSTALMFCTYGNPMLHLRENPVAIEAARQNNTLPSPENTKSTGFPVKLAIKQRLMGKSNNKSLLEDVRGYVDNNLHSIRQNVERYVYQALGLPPQNLSSIDAVSRQGQTGDYSLSYTFNYIDPNARFAAITNVETDPQGNIKRVYTTK